MILSILTFVCGIIGVGFSAYFIAESAMRLTEDIVASLVSLAVGAMGGVGSFGLISVAAIVGGWV